MKYLFSVCTLFLVLLLSCKGQGVKRLPASAAGSRDSTNALKEYQNQKDRFELKGYKLYYNGGLVKPDSLKSIYGYFGQPKADLPEIVYTDKPLWLSAYISQLKNKAGKYLYMYQGNVVTSDKIVNASLDDYMPIYQRENDNTLCGEVYQIRIQLQRYQPLTPGRLTKEDSLLIQIPPLEGYVMVNGYLINKDTPLEELKKKMPRQGGRFGEWAGIPNLVYDATTGHDFKDYDSRIKSDGVHINFLYMPDENGIEKLIRITWEADIRE